MDQVDNSHAFNRAMGIVHNANTEVSGSENRLVPIVD